ncbi:hypothetical protein LIER_13850 [Lithospermum erythrorhizon]|uniref:At1g68980-like TPR repeats domain-containing protein n=1 Tax=Lithospermum erythrorhizon TaxID=34254 RepID=A0AAV3PZF3_LITER
MWRRRTFNLLNHQILKKQFSSQPLYSFLQPSLFSLRTQTPTPPTTTPTPTPPYPHTPLTHLQKSNLETNLETFLTTQQTDEAWKSFKALTNSSCFPSKVLANSLIKYLALLDDGLNIKRAFVSAVYLIEKNPSLLENETIVTILDRLKNSGMITPAFALVKCMFKNRFFVPFDVWGGVLIDICRKNGSFVPFLRVFSENCRVCVEEKLGFMIPDVGSCNAALEGCCRELESVSDADKVVETMSVLGVRPDELTFGLLGYLYALKGLEKKIIELEVLMSKFGCSSKVTFASNVIHGYLKSGNMKAVSDTIFHSLREGQENGLDFSQEMYCEVVKGFLQKGSIKDLATLITEAEKLESSHVEVERSVGYGIVTACINLGLLDKAHSVLDEMNAQGASIGLGVYLSILKAYGKEQRTAEAAQLVTEVNSAGLQLDVGSYDSLIEASMSCQDFQSAFSLFRDMREARIPDLKMSYLSIMTGLMESHRPELMAAFLDEIVEDPRIEVSPHDWNSIIHAFCKAGRLEDARRTFRRMTFLRFEPNAQTYLSLIHGYVSAEKYFNVLMLWNEVKRKISVEEETKFKLDNSLVDAFLYALVKGGFFDAVMEVVVKSQEVKIFVDKWRYKQAFMETHKKLRVSKLKKRNLRKMESLIAFKNWAGLST